MPRRGRGGVVDAGDHEHRGGGADGGDGGIEFFDPDAARRSLDDGREVVEHDSAAGLSPLAVLCGVAVGAVALIGVVNAGNTPAPEPPAPSVTVAPDPVSLAERERAAEVAELEATYGVEIGDGPGLVWQPIAWNVDTNSFAWIVDGFVGQDAETEWTLRLDTAIPSINQSASLQIEYAGYRVQMFEGGRLLIPESGPADHLLVAAGNRPPMRFEMPTPANQAADDDVRITRQWTDGVVLDDRVIAVGHEHLDIERIDPEAGRPVALTFDLVSGAVEAAPFDDLERAESVSRTANGVALIWTDRDGQPWLSTSSDALVWSTAPLSSTQDQIWFSGARMYAVPLGEAGSIRRSSDRGRTWQRTRRPFASSTDHVAVDDILIVTEATALTPSDGPVTVVAAGYEVTISDAGRSFAVVEEQTGDVVTSGAIDEATAIAAFERLGPGLTIVDPSSGEQLVTITNGALLQAYAAINDLEPPDLATTRWDADADDPEWSIQPVDAVFHDAVAVDFVVGPTHLLAIVTTTQGYDFYVASTQASP